MDLTPLVRSSLAIQAHASAAILAIVLGGIVFLMRKGTRSHKLVGRIWVGVMGATALSSFFITETRTFRPFSWIHILSAFTLVMLVRAVVTIRKGDVRRHRMIMTALYALALLITGAFTLLPGRRMNDVIFADGGMSAAIAGVLVLVVVGLAAVASRRLQRVGKRPSASV